MFESHVIIGHINNVYYNEEHKIVSVFVPVQQSNTQPVMWEIALWTEQKEILDKLTSETGSLIAAQVHGVHAFAFLDGEGKPQASVRATVHTIKILTPKTSDNTEAVQGREQ